MKLLLALSIILALTACKPDSKKENQQLGNSISGTSGSLRFDSIINKIARQEKVDPRLVHAVIKQESNYDPNAVSHAGAAGLMQLMPATAKDYGLLTHERFDPVKNIRAGSRHLKMLMKQFNGNLTLVLAAYNAGQGNVIRYGYSVPPFKETQTYVRRVTNFYQANQRRYRNYITEEKISTAQKANLLLTGQEDEA